MPTTITQEQIDKAIAVFLSNPYWKGIYDRSPEFARKYYEILFVYALAANDGETRKAFRNSREVIEPQMKAEDWNYLVETQERGMVKAAFRARQSAILSGDEPKGVIPILLPRYNLDGDSAKGADYDRNAVVSTSAAKKPTDDADNGRDMHRDGRGEAMSGADANDREAQKRAAEGLDAAIPGGDAQNGAGVGDANAPKEKITEDDILAAIYEYIGKVKTGENGEPELDANGEVQWEGGNAYWRDIFLPAPDFAKQRLALSFYFSEHAKTPDGKPNPDFPLIEYRAQRKKIEDAMPFNDIEYLIAHEDNQKMKSHLQDLYKAKMDAQGGDKGEGGDANANADGDKGGDANANADANGGGAAE